MEEKEERLIMAAQEGDLQTIKALLDAGIDVNAKGYSGMTALMHASRNNHVDCVSVLLNAGADVNIKNELGRTALKMAQEKGYQSVIILLESAGAIEYMKVVEVKEGKATGRQKLCPKCMNRSPAKVKRCDCGYEFRDEPPYEYSKKFLLNGVLWWIGGFLVSTTLSGIMDKNDTLIYLVITIPFYFGARQFFYAIVSFLSEFSE